MNISSQISLLQEGLRVGNTDGSNGQNHLLTADTFL